MSGPGWERFTVPGLAPWLEAVRPVADAIAGDPDARAAWLRHGETWFAGVNVLPNDARGAVPGGPPLPDMLGDYPWDAGQLSIVYSGYPQRDADESVAAHRFRRLRDAAHVDGLLPVGPERRRFMQEPHAFVLGLPLNACPAGASPLVVWEGSHEIMRAAFAAALEGEPPARWSEVDLTETYHAARRRCFETCERVPLPGKPGEATRLHRLTLHGVAPWDAGPSDGRMIVYFRPAFAGEDWLSPP
ncbi:MAG: hypothetical protein AAFP13_15340 [Pseudomonadota bacterium]